MLDAQKASSVSVTKNMTMAPVDAILHVRRFLFYNSLGLAHDDFVVVRSTTCNRIFLVCVLDFFAKAKSGEITYKTEAIVVEVR